MKEIEIIKELIELDDEVFIELVNGYSSGYKNQYRESLIKTALSTKESPSARANAFWNLISTIDNMPIRPITMASVECALDNARPSKTSTVDRACKLIQGRANVGQVKYGVSIDRDDLKASDWAQHALEEMLDGAQYLIRLKDEMEALQQENAELKRELSAKSPELSPELSIKSPELKHNKKQELIK